METIEYACYKTMHANREQTPFTDLYNLASEHSSAPLRGIIFVAEISS